ncbi:MAG: response regulator [Cyanobacteria bacterium J06621_11]
MTIDRRSKILAVDDTPDNLFLIEAVFSEEVYHIISAESGEVALKLAQQHLPDLILLDIMMPGMNGYEVTRLIRQNPKTVDIPILLLTARSEAVASKGLLAGANGILYKPFDIDELISRTRVMLS